MSTVRPATANDLDALTALALQLWPDNEHAALRAEFEALLSDGNARLLLAVDAQQPVGFAHGQIRHDYVEGTDDPPTGYLEGIYVLEGCRGQGYARALLADLEGWARARGCRAFASDCELNNEQSLRFHLATGFREANRIICFVKPL